MKKIVFFLILAIMLVSLTSCPHPNDQGTNPTNGQQNNPPDNPPADEPISAAVTLSIFAYCDDDYYEDLCNAFMEENPLITIDLEIAFDEAYHNRVEERLNEGDVPDIAYMGADARWGGKWQDADQQIDNTPYMPANIDQTLIPDFFGTGVKPYIPNGGSNFCTVIGVNMALLEEIGGTLPTTYEEFKTLAQLCADNNIKCLTTPGAADWVWGSCVMSGIIPRITVNLSWVENALYGDAHFTDDDFVASLDVLAQWVADGILSADSLNLEEYAARQTFNNGETLMYINGQWAFSSNNFPNIASDIKLIPIPPVPGQTGCARSIAGAWQAGYGITKSATEKEDPNVMRAAKKWLAYFHSYEATVERINEGAIACPILKDFVAPEGMDPLVSEKSALCANPISQVIDSWLTGNANDTLNAGLKAIVAGTKTAAQVAQEVQDAFDAQQ